MFMEFQENEIPEIDEENKISDIQEENPISEIQEEKPISEIQESKNGLDNAPQVKEENEKIEVGCFVICRTLFLLKIIYKFFLICIKFT